MPKETISNTPWSNFKPSDYNLQQWIRACLIHPPQPSQAKDDYKLPVREPNGMLNKHAVFAVASVLAGGRGGVDATDAQKMMAAHKLMGMYKMMEQEPPPSLKSMMHSSSVDDVLEHFGIKGMKWGVRRSRLPASADAVRVAGFKKTVKRGGTNALTNHELQQLVTRMNLEKQYSSLSPPSKSSMAAKFVTDVLVNVGKQQATKFVNDQATKQIAEMMAKKAAKAAASA